MPFQSTNFGTWIIFAVFLASRAFAAEPESKASSREKRLCECMMDNVRILSLQYYLKLCLFSLTVSMFQIVRWFDDTTRKRLSVKHITNFSLSCSYVYSIVFFTDFPITLAPAAAAATAPATPARSARPGGERWRGHAPADSESAVSVSASFDTVLDCYPEIFNQRILFTVSITCGQTSTENCTYFDNSGANLGACSATICPTTNNICQVNKLGVVFVFDSFF